MKVLRLKESDLVVISINLTKTMSGNDGSFTRPWHTKTYVKAMTYKDCTNTNCFIKWYICEKNRILSKDMKYSMSIVVCNLFVNEANWIYSETQ